MANKYILLFSFSILLGITFSSCKKPKETTPSNTFLKEFGNWSTPFNINNITETSDRGYLFVGSANGLNPVLTRVNKFGNLVWSKSMTNDTFVENYVLSKDDGSFIINHRWRYQLSKIDTNGNLLMSNEFFKDPDNYYSFAPVIKATNGYLGSITDGSSVGASSINYILQFDNNLKLIDSTRFSDYLTLPGKTVTFNVYQAAPAGNYYVWGQKFKRVPFEWSDNEYLYAAKVTHHKWDINVIDSGSKINTYNAVTNLVTNDTGLILLAQRINFAGSTSSVFVASLDKNLKILWQSSYLESGATITPSSISLCSDGGYIISGKDSIGTNGSKPFAVKIDKNGNQEWSKIYSFPGSGQFNSGIELSEGGYLFAGSTVGFGNGKSNQT